METKHRMKQIILVLVALGLAGGAAYAWRGWNKSHALEGQLHSGFRMPVKGPGEAPSNGIEVAELSGQRQENRVVTVSRFFAPEEIRPCAQAVVDNEPLETQCDAKTYWPDGSLQHAVLSFRLTLNARGKQVVTFRSQEDCHNDGALSAEQMLSDSYNFGARMELISPDTQAITADARQILEAGAFRYWLKGPLVTQAIIEDRSPALAFDIGWGAHKSIHPMFIATFVAGEASVKIDLIGEDFWYSKLQELRYDLTLWVGRSAEAPPVYRTEKFIHLPRARWRRTFWTAGAPPRINVDYNLPYLIYSRAVPHFDLAKMPSTKAIDQEVAAYEKALVDKVALGKSEIAQQDYIFNGDHEHTNTAQVLKYFPAQGGRAEIGILPRWDVRYLYTFDPRMEAVVFGNAAASGYAPIHLREDMTGLTFHKQVEASQRVDAFGRLASIDARTGFCSRGDGEFSTGKDVVKFVGAKPPRRQGWSPDLAHQPSLAYTAYLLSGDYYFLEELLFWGGFNVAFQNAGSCNYCRGGYSASDGQFGTTFESGSNIRGIAWGLRAVFYAALMAPTGSPEKAYFEEKVLQNIASLEGRLNMSNGLVSEESFFAPSWEYARKQFGRDTWNPLLTLQYPYEVGLAAGQDTWVNPALTKAVFAPWMHNFCYIVFGMIEEAGMPSRALRRESMRYLLNQFQNPDFNPYLADSYVMPVARGVGEWIPSWKEVFEAFQPSEQKRREWRPTTAADAEHGYFNIAKAAATFLTDIEVDGMSGEKAWEFIRDTAPVPQVQNDNPKWALVPRFNAEPGSLTRPDTWNSRFAKWRGDVGTAAGVKGKKPRVAQR